MVLALAVLLSGCTFGLDFELTGLPCGDGGACLDGFACVSGVCVVAAPDAGAPPLPCNGTCLRGQICEGVDGGEPQCVWECATRKLCPPGTFCGENARCAEVPRREIGAYCLGNNGCDSNLCMLSGTGTGGVCVAPGMVLDGGVNSCTLYAGSVSKKFEPGPGEPIRLCVPISFPQCARQADCDLVGLTCTFWTVPTEPARVVAACAEPPGGAGRDGGAELAEVDESCLVKPCRSGMCVAGAYGVRYCSQPCRVGLEGEADCEVLEHQCQLAPWQNQPPSVKMCLRPAPTLLCPCASPGGPDPACAQDAPFCAPTGFENRCRVPCQALSDCPAGDACTEGLCLPPDGGPTPDGGC